MRPIGLGIAGGRVETTEGRIRRLPAEVVGRIAAGEMITRPAAAVKELVENALDAGGRRIGIRVTESLDRFLEIADDGCGIARDDLVLAIERYATSKIQREEDLLAIDTLGFRGEALAAIAEISRLTLLSRVAEAEHAWQVRAEAGVIGVPQAAARAPGTTVTVEDLFFNTPVRKRFLKKGPGEIRLVRELVQAYASAFPGLAWKLDVDGRAVLDLPPASDLLGRIAQIHGARVAQALLAVDAREENSLALHGFVGGPELARAGARHQTLFVNGRWVVSPWLLQAVRQAFGDLIPNHQSPWAVLSLTLPARELDVNLHPTKREVRFLDERAVFGFIVRAIRPAVARLVPRLFLGGGAESGFASAGGQSQGSAHGGGPGTRAAGPAGTDAGTHGPHAAGAPHAGLLPRDGHLPPDLAARLYRGREGAAGAPYTSAPDGEGGIGGEGFASDGFFASPADTPGTPLSSPGSGTREGLVSLWQLHHRYIFAQTHQGLLIIDQHAAHERILYERIRERMRSGDATAQQLLFPALIELEGAEMEIYRDERATLAAMGFDCEELDDRTLLVRGIPPLWRARSEAGLVRDLLAEAEAMSLREGETIEGFARAFACQAAIKAGEPLNVEEMNRLVDELFATTLPHGDPHGRPTFVFLSLAELDRRFARSAAEARE